jgi:hypothetical protein
MALFEAIDAIDPMALRELLIFGALDLMERRTVLVSIDVLLDYFSAATLATGI